LAWDRVADVDQRAADLRDEVMGTVLVADDHDAGDAIERDRGRVVAVGLRQKGVHSLERALGDARGLPEQVGVATTRISAARIRSRIAGHSSPSTTASETTPGSI